MLSLSEASAVMTVLKWISHEPSPGGVYVSDGDAVRALTKLAENAGRALQLPPRPGAVADAVARCAAERERGRDGSD